jgi:hypothetical protein
MSKRKFTSAELLCMALADALAVWRAMERAAQLLDHVGPHHWMLPHNDEFDVLLLEHIQWVEKMRLAGELPPAKTIKRPVTKPRKRKPVVCDAFMNDVGDQGYKPFKRKRK